MCPHLLLVWCFVAMGGPFALCRHLHYLFHVFKISLDHARTSFYRSANAIFGKVGRVANYNLCYNYYLVNVCPQFRDTKHFMEKTLRVI